MSEYLFLFTHLQTQKLSKCVEADYMSEHYKNPQAHR